MDANYRRQRYVYGAEAPAEVPERVPRRTAPLTKEEQRRRQASRYAEENRRRAHRFGFVYTMFVAAAVGITMISCIGYIKVQNKQTTDAKTIANLQSTLSDMKEQNDQKKLEIDSSINYDYIYKVATEELGMVHADGDQVVKYKSGESEYVIQYSDVE